MARHRNIRTRDFAEEYEDYDYQLGRSVDEDFSVSPGTANQYLFDHNFAQRRNSETYHSNEKPEDSVGQHYDPNENVFLADEDLMKKSVQQSSIDHIKEIFGKSKSDKEIVNALDKANQNIESAIDLLFKQSRNQNSGLDNTSNAGHFSKNDISSLYKALATEYNFENSPDFINYNIKKPIKEYVAKSLKQNRATNLSERRDSSKSRASPMIKEAGAKAKTKEAEPEKKDKKIPSKLVVEPNKPAVASPNIKIKNIKQKPIEEIKKIYEKKRLNGKLQLNLVIVGHVDAGKSTIMGHLLSLMGNISKKSMHKNETEARKAGKASFMYAWVLDETEEERNRGITIDVGQYRFETEKQIVNILDAPGHRDFIPNMITGTTKADCAMLVIDATNGEFESGFESGGQTQEHILLLRSFGITQVVVAINKMDNVNFNPKRYEEIVEKIRKFLKQVGFKDSTIEYVPCSGITGDNLVKLSNNSHFSWYQGPTLIDVIDRFSSGPRPIEKPFRMSISDFYKGQTSGIYLHGKVDYGYVETNQRLQIVPSNEICTVKNIMINEEIQPEAFAGDVVAINISIIDGLEISIGNVLCDISCPCTMATKFEARIVTFGTLETPIIHGTSVVIYSVCCLDEAATISKLCGQLDKNKNEMIKKNPRLVSRNQAALVHFKTARPICVETYDNCKIYGKFVFRSEHITLGTGIVTKILK